LLRNNAGLSGSTTRRTRLVPARQTAEWEGVKDALPLLSKRFYTLHRSVWGQDRPKSGWFGNAGQTLKYVDSVMDYYDDFRLALN